MTRNYPELRPRELFPEDGWDEQAMREAETDGMGQDG